MSEPHHEIASFQPKELAIPFPLIQSLFREGERVFGGVYNNSDASYYDEEGTATKPKLPEKFAALTLGGELSKYYFVYYSDRRDSSFAEGTRGQSACISTQEKKAASNDRLREIIYSNGSDGFYATIGENINNRAFLEWQGVNEEGLVNPSGRIQAKYKLVDGGEGKLVEFTASRVDEIMFENVGEIQPGRWTRNLNVDEINGHTKYQELYIVNRSKQPGQEKRANITFRFDSALNSPNSITIAVGLEIPGRLKKTLVSPDGKVHIETYSGSEETFGILSKDQNYSFLVDTELDSDKVITFVRERIILLQEHWDKPQSIFTNSRQIDSPPKQLTRD